MMSDKTLSDLKYDAHVAVLHTKVDALIEKQKELTGRVRANEKVVAAIGLLGSIALAFIGAGYFAPKAEACSPRLDGEPTYCGPQDGVLERPVAVIEPEEEEPKYIRDWNAGRKVVFLDSREDKPLVIMETYQHMINAMRDWKLQKERTSVEDMLNTSLAEYENGSYGSTEQEELLQLQSHGD